MVARCTQRDSLSQPNSHKPGNVDSRKKAASPSIASGAPNMLPTSLNLLNHLSPVRRAVLPYVHPAPVLHVRVVSPAEVTERLVGMLAADPGVINLVVIRAAATGPDGDAVQFDLTNASANSVLKQLRDLGLSRRSPGHPRDG
jgi:hypothetical protein